VTKTVELVQAFLWTCDGCGRDNFERGVTIDIEAIDVDRFPASSPEATELIRDWIEAGGETRFVERPDHVRCRHCGAGFATTEP
jgi:hypothetical protein